MWMKKMAIILLFFLVFIPDSVFGEVNDINLKCSEFALLGNKISCVVSLKTDHNIKGIQANFENGEQLIYLNSNVGSDWSQLVANSSGFSLVNTTGISHDSKIMDISFSIPSQLNVSESYFVKLSNIFLSDGERDIAIEDKIFNFKILPLDDLVESISIAGQQLEIKDGVDNYTIEVGYETTSVDLGAILKNDHLTFANGYGPREISDLKVGDNIVYLKILNDSSEFLNYSINIKRLEKSSEIVENPKTGINNFSIIFIFMILIGSLVVGLLFYFKRVREVDSL